ncbi:hypothetical protein A5722_16960 [Mycobacterium vulneris]|nr:hypothetical protein A5722_16960 [Mycolicibacterium vulneris]OCB65572.1 hypothetical protein A5729_15795 [Mycolicibacterium vulneris]
MNVEDSVGISAMLLVVDASADSSATGSSGENRVVQSLLRAAGVLATNRPSNSPRSEIRAYSW